MSGDEEGGLSDRTDRKEKMSKKNKGENVKEEERENAKEEERESVWKLEMGWKEWKELDDGPNP